MLWCLSTSYYDILDIPHAGLLRADTPWSGHYTVMPPLWIVAHTTQFVQPGWQYLDRASSLLPEGGSLVALKSGSEFSVIAETLAASRAQEVTFRVRGGLSSGQVSVWRTDPKRSFEKIDEIVPAGGKSPFGFSRTAFILLLPPHLSTRATLSRPSRSRFQCLTRTTSKNIHLDPPHPITSLNKRLLRSCSVRGPKERQMLAPGRHRVAHRVDLW